MPLTFTSAERLAITRRQVRIELENEGFQESIDSFTDDQAALLQVDNSNTKFYDYYNSIAQAYENEVRYMNGTIPDVYLPSDVTTAGENPNVAPFFPSDPTTAYSRSIPLIQDGTFTNNKVKGYFHSTGTDSRREQNILTNVSVYDGLTELIYRLDNGITGATPTTSSATAAIPAGPVTGHVLTVTSTTNLLVGELIYCYSGANSGIYKITAVNAGVDITIDSVVPTLIGIASANIDNTVVAFTNSERENITSTLFQEIITNLTNRIDAVVTEWEGKVDSIITTLGLNQDDRSPQAGEIVTALADVNNSKSIIDTWQALPNTGVGARYTSTGISPLTAEVTARISFVATRITQIITALGTSSGSALVQSGETYSTSVPNNPYFNRYKWLNFRINLSSGSLRRYYEALQASDSVTQLKADNDSILAEYNGYFITKPLVFNDGSDIVHVKNTTGLSPGNTVTVVSETQPEISRTISSLMGTTQIKLNAAVPVTYRLEDIARIFKTV